MERLNFLAELREACAELREHFEDTSAEWLTSVVPESVSEAPTDKRGVEYIFELLCYFAFVRGLKFKKVQNLRLVRAPGQNGFRFPYSPGEKRNFAFFRFEWNGQIYDVCAGTAVHPPQTPADDPDEHPDISLQLIDPNSTDQNREPGEVIALWDAKHHGENMSKADENQLLRWCSLFPRTKGNGCLCSDYYRHDDLLETICPPAFQISAVLTNAPAGMFSSASAYRFGYSFVFEFDGDTQNRNPTPTRSEHYGHCQGLK